MGGDLPGEGGSGGNLPGDGQGGGSGSGRVVDAQADGFRPGRLAGGIDPDPRQ